MTGGLIFLRLGGVGVTMEGWGTKAASSSEEIEGEESEVGDCFPRRRLRRVTDLVDSLWGFFGRGLLEEVGVAEREEDPLAEDPFGGVC